MKASIEQTLVEVWRQVLIENVNVVELDGKRYSVRITPNAYGEALKAKQFPLAIGFARE